jgi:hypothetical protein
MRPVGRRIGRDGRACTEGLGGRASTESSGWTNPLGEGPAAARGLLRFCGQGTTPRCARCGHGRVFGPASHCNGAWPGGYSSLEASRILRNLLQRLVAFQRSVSVHIFGSISRSWLVPSAKSEDAVLDEWAELHDAALGYAPSWRAGDETDASPRRAPSSIPQAIQ